MIKRILFKICLGFTLSSLLFACTEEIDFDQAEDLVIKPVVSASLAYFDEPATQFFVAGTEVTSVQDFVSVEFFNNEFVVDNVEKAELVFETKNTINRTFELQIDFLDASGRVQHSFIVREDASGDNADEISTHTEVFENGTLNALKRTTQMVFTLRMLPGEPLTANTPGRVEYKSYAAFYLNLNQEG
ncbi:hypothetical protein ACFFU1_11715 [Algibacter miyuki]|uniref:Uncharacterized protein n=1 Tax=Algibacter miyuki TaxID=1306933 RepID=A0ABV5H1H2_9FLAO|nr:hypothetical protein [Algibacter miyuki]MDN3666186.1 hypothetical protein [Algibacter miyuki]